MPTDRQAIHDDDHIPARYILDAAGVRQHCGDVTRATFIRWRTNHGFPDPFLTLPSGTELWHRADVDHWLKDTANWRRRRRRTK